MEEGSSAADCVTDVTDVTDRGPMAVGSSATDVTDRMKKEEEKCGHSKSLSNKNLRAVWAVAIS